VADTPSITIIKTFTYRSAPEEFSNRYHFTGMVPADAGDWHDIAVALGTMEASVYTSNVSVVRAYGYLSDGTDAVATIDFTVSPLSPLAGTAGPIGTAAPGDDAMVCRWKTARVSSKGKPIYLRKFFHGVHLDDTDSDSVNATQLTALQAFAEDALSPWGSTDAVLAGPDGVTPANPFALPLITTRTLKRRGRRPPS
jgi:hypothetical protein